MKTSLYLQAQEDILNDLINTLDEGYHDTVPSIKGLIRAHLNVITRIKNKKESDDVVTP